MSEPIPDGVRRFVLTSIPTVPHLETLLLLWREPGEGWLVEDIARRLYVPSASAEAIAEDLCQADLLVCDDEPRRYRCRREPATLAALFAALDQAYARRLREVTALIHSHVDRKASRFADAFRLRKDKE
jgi:DNA-binding IclR family transcriptional regulator